MSLKLFNLQGLELQRLYPFEALAEISDFVAGLVQRVPKKPNEVKVDLQNSTAYSLRSLRVTVVERLFFIFFGVDGLNIGQILRLQRLTPFSLRMTKWEDCLSISVNYLKSLL